jgi:hypothetical protein
MDAYNKGTRDDVHSAIGLAAGALVLYETWALLGRPGLGEGGRGGPGPVTYVLYVKNTNGVLLTTQRFPTVAAASAWIAANLPSTAYPVGTWVLDDSNGNHISGGAFGKTVVNTYYQVTTGSNNITAWTGNTTTEAIAFIKTLPKGTLFHLFQILTYSDGTQQLVELSSGTI